MNTTLQRFVTSCCSVVLYAWCISLATLKQYKCSTASAWHVSRGKPSGVCSVRVPKLNSIRSFAGGVVGPCAFELTVLRVSLPTRRGPCVGTCMVRRPSQACTYLGMQYMMQTTKRMEAFLDQQQLTASQKVCTCPCHWLESWRVAVSPLVISSCILILTCQGQAGGCWHAEQESLRRR